MSYYACSAIKALTPNAYRRRQRKANLTGTATSIANTNGNAKVISTSSANAKARAGTSNRSRTSGLENLHSIKRHSNAKKANAKANSNAHMNLNSNSKSNARNANSNIRTRANSRIATRSLVHNHGNGNGNGNGAIIPSIPGLSGNVPPPSTTITFGNRINGNGNGNGTNNGKLDYAPALSQLTMTQSFSQSMDGTATTSSYGNMKHKGKATGRGDGNYQSQSGKGNVNRTTANTTTTRTRNGYPTRSQSQSQPQSQYQPRTTSTMSVPRNMVLTSAPSFSSSISQSKVKSKSKAMPHSSLPSQAMMSNQNQKQRMNNNWTAGTNINTRIGSNSNSNSNSNARTKSVIANATGGNNNRNQNQNRTRPQNSAARMAMGLNRIDSSTSSSNIPIKNRTQNQTQSRPRPGPNVGPGPRPRPGPGPRPGSMGRTSRGASASSKGINNLNQARRKMRQEIDMEDNGDHSDAEDYNDEDDGYNPSHNQEETLTSQPLLPPIPSSSSSANRSITSRSRSMTTGNVAPHAHNAHSKKRSWMDACVDILSTPYRRTRSRPTPTNIRAGGSKSSIGANGNGNRNGNGSNIRATSAAQSLSLANTTAGRDVANRTTATTVSADSDNRSDENLCDGNDVTNKSIDRSNTAPALVPATRITGGVHRKEHAGTGGEILSTAISTVSSTFQTPSRDNSSAIVPSGGTCADTSADAGAETRIVATSEATTALSKYNGDANGGNSKGNNSGSNALVPFDPNSTGITIAQQQHHDQMQMQLQKYKDEMTKTANELRSKLISELTQHETQLVSSTKATLTELRLQSTTEAEEAIKKLSTEIEQGTTQHLSEAKQKMVKDVEEMEETLKGTLSLVTSKQKNTMLELEKASSDQLNRAKEEGMSFWDDFQKRRLEMEQNLEEKRNGMLDEVDRVVKEVFDGSDAEGNAEKVADCKSGNTTAANASESARSGLRERIEMEKNGALDTVRSAVQLMVENMIVSAKEKVDKIWKEDDTNAHCAQEKKVIPASPSPADDVGVVGVCNTDITNSSEDISKRNCSKKCKVNCNEKACDAETRKVTPFHSSNKNPIVHTNQVDEDALAKSTSNQDFVEDCNGKTGLQARKCNSPKEVTPPPHPVTKAHARPTGKTMSSDDNSNKPNKKKETSRHVKSTPSEKKKRIQKPRRAKKNNSKTPAAINKSRTKTRRRKVVDPQTNASKKDSPLHCKSKVDSLPQTIHITSESQQPVSPLRLPDMRAPRRSGTQRELVGTVGGNENKKQQDKMKKKSSLSSSADAPLEEELGTATATNQDLASDGKKLVKSTKQVSTKQARVAVRRYNLRSKVSSDHTKSSMKLVGTSRIEENDKSQSMPVEVAGGAIGTVQTVQTIPDPQFTSQNLDRVKPLRAKQPIAEKLQRKTPSGDKSTRRILPPGVSSSASYSSQILPDTSSPGHNSKHTQKNNKMLQPSTPKPASPIKRTPTVTGRKHLSQKENAPDAPKLRLRRRKRSTYAGRSRTTRTGRNDEGDIQFTSSAAMLSLGNLKISDTRYNSLQLPNVESIINNDENAPVMPFTSPTGPTQSLAPRLPDLDELRYRPHRRTTLDIRTRPRLFDVDANDIFEFS